MVLKIMISGARTPEYLKDPSIGFVQDLCKLLGERVIEEGWHLLTGASNGIDKLVSQSANKICEHLEIDYRDRISIYYHWKPKHNNGALYKSKYNDRSEGLPEIVEYADIGVLLSGFTGTAILADWMINSNKPLICIGATGGAAKRYNEQLISKYSHFNDENLLRLLRDVNSRDLSSNEVCGSTINLVKLLANYFIENRGSTNNKPLPVIDYGIKEKKLEDIRFKVSLSFPGEKRGFVAKVSEILKSKLGKDHVFYDQDYKAYLARPNSDAVLQKIYNNSELIVVFLCVEYSKNEWCILEWRAIREIIKVKEDSKVMFVRFDDTTIDGVLSIDGYIDATANNEVEVAELILQRLPESL